MQPSFFNNTTVEIYKYIDNEDYDEYGEKQGEYALECTVQADIQPISAKDSLQTFGEILQDTYKLFLSSTVNVESSSLLKIGEDTFTIIGSPETWNHVLQYKQLTIQKQRINVKS